MKIYLAGKIRKVSDWREGIVNRSSMLLPSDAEGWPILENAVLGSHAYTGPYQLWDSSGEHRCFGGSASHGVGANKPWDNPADEDYPSNRNAISELCRAAIINSDAVFAWIDDAGAYGTCAEIGYATALGKPVFIGIETNFHLNREAEANEYWFIQEWSRQGVVWHGPKASLEWFLESLQPKTFVYFIEAVGLEKIKIGYSADPDSRLSTLQTGSAAELRLLGRIRGTKDTEAQLHRKFAGLRMAGEWFHGTQEIRQHIAQLCQGGA